MTNPIRLGLIGCGTIATRRHLPGLAALKKAGLNGFDVAAVCDANEDNATTASTFIRENLGDAPRIYRDWQDLVSDRAVDAVDICLPHGLHHVVGVACLDAGLHVVMEKPLAVSIKAGKRLVEAARRAGSLLSAAIPQRRLHGPRTVHWALNEAKLIGDVQTFFYTFAHYRPPPAARATAVASPAANASGAAGTQWRRERVMGGGNTIIDSGTHFVDTLRYLHGDVDRVYAEVRAYAAGQPVVRREDIARERENTTLATFTMKSGATGTWCWTTAAAGAETHACVVYGSEGSLEDKRYHEAFPVMVFRHGAELRLRDGTHLSMDRLRERHRGAVGPEGLQRLFPNGVTDEFALTLWDFIRAVRTGSPPEIDGQHGLVTLATTEALYESSWIGQSVDVDALLSGETPSLWQADIDAYWDEQATAPAR